MPETVGELLRNARNERKITLDQAAQATRIRVRYLEALENNQHNALPSDVQARGFLRLYSDFLGLPERSLLDAWAGKPPEEPPAPQILEPEPEYTPPAAEPLTVEDVGKGYESYTLHEEEEDAFVESPPEEQIAQSIQIYREVGKTLRKQRELLGISLEDVERYTHIRRHYLEAMEMGRMEYLPSPVQGQGMLNNYARFIEVDADALLLHYADGLQAHRVEKLSEQSGPKRKHQSAEQVKQPGLRQLVTADMIIGASIILLVFAAGIWSLAQITGNNTHPDQATAPSVVDVLMSTPATLLAPVQLATSESTRVYSGAAIDQPPQNNIEHNSSGIETPTPPVPIDTAPLQISVISNQRAWMRITVDDNVVFNSRVLPNKTYQFSGTKQIDLITGNAAAIQVYFNQQDLGILGLVGQVASMVFTSQGVITPTALPSPTGTPTQPTTPTVTAPTPTLATPTVTPFIPQ